MSHRGQLIRRSIFSLSKFGMVGFAGFIVDVGVFNLLTATVLAPQHIHGGPMIAKFISVSLAILTNWIGNRNWTFRSSRNPNKRREAVEFFVASIGTMPISLICLWISHYALGLTSPIADNISANIVGTILGAAARYWLYRSWVFRTPVQLPSTTSEIRLVEVTR